MNLSKLFKTVTNTCKANAPQILTGIGISSMLLATATAVVAAPKVIDRIEKRRAEVGDDNLTALEIVKTAAPVYIPTIALSVIGGGCIIAGCHEGSRRSTAYATVASSLNAVIADKDSIIESYKKTVRELAGDKKADRIEEKVQEEYEQRKSASQVVVLHKTGNVMFEDMLTGQKFDSLCLTPDAAMNKVEKALNDYNYEVLNSLSCEIGFFLDKINEPPCAVGDLLFYNERADIRTRRPYALGDGTIVVPIEYRGKIHSMDDKWG